MRHFGWDMQSSRSALEVLLDHASKARAQLGSRSQEKISQPPQPNRRDMTRSMRKGVHLRQSLGKRMVFERKDHKTAQNTREVQVCMNRKLCSPKGFGNLGLVTKLDLESTDQISLGIGHVLFHSGVCTIASDHFYINSTSSY